jgi:hypothetical protein
MQNQTPEFQEGITLNRASNPGIAPYHKRAKTPRTVADALSAIEQKYAAMGKLSRKEKSLLGTLRRTCRRISEMLNNLPLAAIYLDELVELDKPLIQYIEGLGINRESAVQYSCDMHKLLDLAHKDFGWTSKAYELRKAWRPVRAVLRGRGKGCGSIIRFAIRHGKTPAKFDQQSMNAWKRYALGDKRLSLLTVDIEECHFRKVLRNAGFQSLFSNWSLASKNPPQYRLRLRDRKSAKLAPDLPEMLRDEILEAIHWKTVDEDLEDRDAELLIRPVTGQQLLRHFVELYSYAIKILGLVGICHLHQLLTEKVVCGFIDWLQQKDDNGQPRCQPQSVITKLSTIHYLTRTYPKLKGGDYGDWFRIKMNSLRKQKHSQVQARKLEGKPDYNEVAVVASKILALRENTSGLSELEVAWLFHDALIFAISVVNPYRSRTLREAKFHPRMRMNIFETEITTELLNHLKLPLWAKELRDKDPKATFVVFHALEENMKAGHELWQLLPKEAASIFEEYVQYYRPLIVRTLHSNASTLFLARNGNPLTQKSLLNLVKRIGVRHASKAEEDDKGDKRITVKLFRDLVGAQMLATGATIEEVADCLAQLDPYRTTARFYVGGYNASHGVAALEDELAALGA